jgi:dTDP-4-dehydrorhamnose reductase
MSPIILVTGGTGQLATALARLRPETVVVTGRPGFDFDRPETIATALRAQGPALVINAAAWTAVDAAEAEPDAADRANHTGPALLAATCHMHGIPLIHVSTDYVFDGLKGEPYVETDPTSPTGVYGATKLAGETAVLAAHPSAVVLRTSWVYAGAGKNFVLTMLNAAKSAPRLRVVADQIGCPTNAADLAAAALSVADCLLAAPRDELGGIYHAAGQGQTSWHGLATEIFATAGRHGWPTPPVDPIATADWPTPARRPPDSRLDCGKLEAVFGVRLPQWQKSLQATVAGICQAAQTGAALAAAPG